MAPHISASFAIAPPNIAAWPAKSAATNNDGMRWCWTPTIPSPPPKHFTTIDNMPFGDDMTKHIGRGFLVTLAALFVCAEASATFLTLAMRLPESTNAIVAVNVSRLVVSPYGKNAQWGERLAEAWANQPLMIPPGAQRLIMAADVKPSSLDSIWEMSLIDMDKVPSLETIAKDEG